eukprot:UN17748
MEHCAIFIIQLTFQNSWKSILGVSS